MLEKKKNIHTHRKPQKPLITRKMTVLKTGTIKTVNRYSSCLGYIFALTDSMSLNQSSFDNNLAISRHSSYCEKSRAYTPPVSGE